MADLPLALTSVFRVVSVRPGNSLTFSVGDLSDVAALRLTRGDSTGNTGATTAVTLGVLSPGDGGQGVWRWDPQSVAADDVGMVVQVTGVPTGRWVRQIEADLQGRWFGATANGVAFDDVALAAALAAAQGREVVLGPGAWNLGSTLAIPARQAVRLTGGALTTLTLAAGATIAANARLEIGLGSTVYTADSLKLAGDGAQLVGHAKNHTVVLAPNVLWTGAAGASLSSQNAIVTAVGPDTPAGLMIKGIWVSRNGHANITGFRNDTDIGYSVVEDFVAQPITYGIHLHHGCGQSKFTRFLLAANDAADTEFDTGVLIEGNPGGVISCVFEQFTVAQHSRYGVRIVKVGNFDGGSAIWIRDGDIESTSGGPALTAIAGISITSGLAIYIHSMHMESGGGGGSGGVGAQAAIELGDATNVHHYPRSVIIKDCNWGPFQHGIRAYGWQDLLVEGVAMDSVDTMFKHATPTGDVQAGGRWVNNTPLTTAVQGELDSTVGFDLIVKDGGSNNLNTGPQAPEMHLSNMILRKTPTITANLPAAGVGQNGRIEIEDAGGGACNLVVYVGANRFRLPGTSF